MKTLKLSIILLSLLSIIACKKNSVVTPEPIKEPFDIKEYVLLRKYIKSNGWVTDVRLTSFESQGKSTILSETGILPDDGFKYSYDNNTLKLIYNSRVNTEFKIENNNIVASSGNAVGTSYKLIKIPNNNPFKGNTYAGGWQIEGSLLFTIAKVKFTDTHFSEASVNLPAPNKTYDLFKNIAALKINDDGVSTLWFLAEGKLEGYRNTLRGGNWTRTNASFTQQ